MRFILLKEPEAAGFVFWFLTELFFEGVVVFLLYYFFVKNPKINKTPRRDEEED
jgi:prolipoprotein diacylglyceryltransferase